MTEERPAKFAWDGLTRLIDLGFDDRQIRLILNIRSYHLQHPEALDNHCTGPGECHALEAITKATSKAAR